MSIQTTDESNVFQVCKDMNQDQQPIATPRCDYAFDGDISVGVLPQLETWEDAKKFARTLERELILATEELNRLRQAHE